MSTPLASGSRPPGGLGRPPWGGPAAAAWLGFNEVGFAALLLQSDMASLFASDPRPRLDLTAVPA